MGLNDAVRGGVSNAGEDESVAHLLVIEEGLIGLVDVTADNLSGARGASSGPAGVGEVNASLLSSVEDVDIVSDINDLNQELEK